MMYLVFNEDGSKKEQKLNQFIQQGNSYANFLFVAIVGKNPATYNLTANFTLPNGKPSQVVSLSGQTETITIGEDSYTGRYLNITSDQTQLEGALKINIVATSVSTEEILVSTTTYVTVNEGVSPSDPVLMTETEYLNLISLIGKQVERPETIYKANQLSDLGEVGSWENGQVFYILSLNSLYKANSTTNDYDLIVDLNDTISKTKGTFQNPEEISSYLWLKHSLYLGTGNTKPQAYISGNYEGNSIFVQAEGKQYVFSPSAITGYQADLGSSSILFKDLHLSGLLKDGTNSVSIAQIETKTHASSTYTTKEEAQAEHENLQEQIDAIVSKSDVVDIVGTHAKLLEYDTSKLGDKDIIKVLVDETKQNQRSYYRWLKDDEEFDYIGSEGEFYTKAESDTIFLKKVDAETTYQHKVKVFDHKPSTSELANGEVGVVPSVEPDDYIIGDGLKVINDTLTTDKYVAETSQITEIVGKGVSVPVLTYLSVRNLISAVQNNTPAYIQCLPLHTTFQVVSGHLITSLSFSLNIVLEHNGITYLVNYKVNSGTNVVITASDMPTAPFVLDNVELGDIEGTYEGELTKAECDRLFLHDNMIIDFPDQVSNGIHYYLKKAVEEVNANNIIYSSDDWIFKLNSVNYKFTIEPVKHTKLYKHTILLGGTDQTKLVLILANHKTQFSGSASILAEEKYISSAVEFYKIDGSTTSTITIFQKKLVIGAKNSPASLFVLHATAQGASTESIALSGVSIVSDTVEEL